MCKFQWIYHSVLFCFFLPLITASPAQFPLNPLPRTIPVAKHRVIFQTQSHLIVLVGKSTGEKQPHSEGSLHWGLGIPSGKISLLARLGQQGNPAGGVHLGFNDKVIPVNKPGFHRGWSFPVQIRWCISLHGFHPSSLFNFRSKQTHKRHTC